MKKNKKISVVRKWIISYICILFIPLFLCVIVSYQIAGRFKDELSESNDLMLNGMQSNVDNLLNEAEKLVVDFSHDERVNAILKYKENLTGAQYWELSRLSAEILAKKSSTDAYLYMMIYFADIQYVVSAGSVKDLDTYIYVDAPKNGVNEFRDLITTPHGGEYITIAQDSVNRLFYAQSLPIVRNSPCDANIIIELNTEFAEKMMSSLSSGSIMLIYDKDGNVVYNSGGFSEEDSEKALEAYEKGSVSVKLAHDKYLCSSSSNSTHGWRLFLLTPQKGFLAEVNKIYKIIFVMFIISLLLGIALVIIVARMQYKPIREIMELIGGKNNRNTADEYRYIYENISEMLSNVRELQSVEDNSKDTLRKYSLFMLLSGKFDYSKLNERTMELLGFQYRHFTVAVCYVDAYDGLFADEQARPEEEKRSIAEFAIQNVLTELLSRYFICEMIEMNDFLVCCINSQDAAVTETLKDVFNEAMNFLKQNFYIEFFVSLSAVCHDLREIDHAYGTACKKMEQNIFYKNDRIVFCDSKGAEESKQQHYIVSNQTAFINYIKLGNAKEACGFLEEIFEADPQISRARINSMVYDVANTIARVIEEETAESAEEMFKENGDIEKILAQKDFDDMKASLFACVTSYCQKIKNVQEAKKTDSGLINNVIQYVDENYCNCDISVGYIAEAMGVHEYYLSSTFKNSIGIGLLEYIYRKRIETVKRLLAESGKCSLERIATTVGFQNSRTLNRAFKKFEGIAPSKYRDMILNEENKLES